MQTTYTETAAHLAAAIAELANELDAIAAIARAIRAEG